MVGVVVVKVSQKYLVGVTAGCVGPRQPAVRASARPFSARRMVIPDAATASHGSDAAHSG